MNTKELTRDMFSAFGRNCIRKCISCTPDHYNLKHRIEADLICVDKDMFIHEIEVKAMVFTVYCLIYDKNGRKRIECKRTPTLKIWS